MRITALERKPRRRTIDLHVDGEPALRISPDVCLQFGLRSGQQISPETLEAVRQAETRHKAMASALRLLAYRPRSERELRDRLAAKGTSAALIDSVVGRLREAGLIDDAAFADHFAESRDRTSPRSRRLIAAELRARGVERSIADRTTTRLDEGDAAYRAAARRAKTLAGKPYPDFRRRLGDLLLRRGFDYDLADETVRRLWDEMQTPDRNARPAG